MHALVTFQLAGSIDLNIVNGLDVRERMYYLKLFYFVYTYTYDKHFSYIHLYRQIIFYSYSSVAACCLMLFCYFHANQKLTEVCMAIKVQCFFQYICLASFKTLLLIHSSSVLTLIVYSVDFHFAT